MVRAWRDLPGLRDPDRFDAWLHRLLVNACLDLVRRRKRRVIEVELTPIDQPGAADVAGGVADRQLIDRALARLEPGHRAVVVLHYFLGMPLPDVARVPGHPARHGEVTPALALGALRTTWPARPRTIRPPCRRAVRMTAPSASSATCRSL